MIELRDLRDLSVFEGVCDVSLGRAAAHAADVRVDEGQWVVREGEPAAFFVVLEGELDLVKRYRDGLQRLGIRTRGDHIGEVPLVLDAPFFACAQARTPLRLARFDRQQFGVLIQESSELRERLMETVRLRIEGLEARGVTPPRLPVLVGRSGDPDCHELREFLSRNQVPFEWADPQDGASAHRVELAGALEAASDCSVVLLPDGRMLVRPTRSELAVSMGLQVEPRHETYDVVVVGGGPAGLAAAVYGASEGLRTLLVEREATGGQAGTSTRIENYLGFPSGVSGDELAGRAREQALRLGAEIVVTRRIEAIHPQERCHRVTLDGGAELGARALVLATGVSYRTLGADGLERFEGSGVFYGASRTEAPALSGRDVILVGGGNSAGQAAVFFADYARSVTILIRGASLDASMSRYLIEELARKSNVHLQTCGEVVGVAGDLRLERVTVRNREDGSLAQLPADALFIFIGADANTGWLPDQMVRDERGYLCTGRDVAELLPGAWPLQRDPYLLETSVPGIFAAGDVRHGSIKRVASGVGEGSIAIAFVHEHLAELDARAEAAAT